MTSPAPLLEPHAPTAEQALRLLFPKRGSVIVLRALASKGRTHAITGKKLWTQEGNYEDLHQAAQDAEAFSRIGYEIFVGLHRAKPDVLARSANRMSDAQSGGQLCDDDITHYANLLIDIDSVRLKGASATEVELERTLQVAERIQGFLRALLWPEALYRAMSGNGVHLVYRVSFANTPENVRLVRETLEALSRYHSDDRVKIDTSVHNPSRIAKLPGTMARKGDNLRERPWRVARIEEFHADTTAVKIGQLRDLARTMKEEPKPRRLASELELEDLVELYEKRGLQPRRKEWKERPLIASRCWREDHGNASAFATQDRDGKWFARCHAVKCDADTDNWRVALGIGEPASNTNADPQDVDTIVEKMNAYGLVYVLEGSTALYVLANAEMGERVFKRSEKAREHFNDWPRISDDDGRPLHAFSVWSASDKRRKALGSTWTIGAEYGAIVGEGLRTRLNRFQGLAYPAERSAEGDAMVKTWRAHLEESVCDGRTELAKHLWKVFAWKVQRPLEVPGVLVVLQGPPGCGKGFALRPLLNLFGAHGAYTQREQLKFNSRFEGKCFVFHDEAEFLADPRVVRSLRALVTEEAVAFEGKGVDEWEGTNMAMHVMATEQPQIALSPRDRRVFLLSMRAPEGGARWLEKTGMADVVWPNVRHGEKGELFHRSLRWHLEHERLQGFRPQPLPSTGEREEQISVRLPPLEMWVQLALDRGHVPGIPSKRWGEDELTLNADERDMMLASFRAWVESRSTGFVSGVVGYTSMEGFGRKLVGLLGVQSSVSKQQGAAKRCWTLPAKRRSVALFTATVHGETRKD